MFNRNKVAEATFDTAFLTYINWSHWSQFLHFPQTFPLQPTLEAILLHVMIVISPLCEKCADVGILRAQMAAVSKSSNVRQI